MDKPRSGLEDSPPKPESVYPSGSSRLLRESTKGGDTTQTLNRAHDDGGAMASGYFNPSRSEANMSLRVCCTSAHAESGRYCLLGHKLGAADTCVESLWDKLVIC